MSNCRWAQVRDLDEMNHGNDNVKGRAVITAIEEQKEIVRRLLRRLVSQATFGSAVAQGRSMLKRLGDAPKLSSSRSMLKRLGDATKLSSSRSMLKRLGDATKLSSSHTQRCSNYSIFHALIYLPISYVCVCVCDSISTYPIPC